MKKSIRSGGLLAELKSVEWLARRYSNKATYSSRQSGSFDAETQERNWNVEYKRSKCRKATSTGLLNKIWGSNAASPLMRLEVSSVCWRTPDNRNLMKSLALDTKSDLAASAVLSMAALLDFFLK